MIEKVFHWDLESFQPMINPLSENGFLVKILFLVNALLIKKTTFIKCFKNSILTKLQNAPLTYSLWDNQKDWRQPGSSQKGNLTFLLGEFFTYLWWSSDFFNSLFGKNYFRFCVFLIDHYPCSDQIGNDNCSINEKHCDHDLWIEVLTFIQIEPKVVAKHLL